MNEGICSSVVNGPECFCGGTRPLMLRHIAPPTPSLAALWLTSRWVQTSCVFSCISIAVGFNASAAVLSLCTRPTATLCTPLCSPRWTLQQGGCVFIRGGSLRCVARPLWSPRSLVPFVPGKPGDTVTARGRKELSVVGTAGNTCFTLPSRGPRRIEERQLVGLAANQWKQCQQLPSATHANRPATTGTNSSVFG